MRIRDQERARQAYMDVESVESGEREDYKIVVNSFGTFVLREGLAAAVAWVERDGRSSAQRLLRQLGKVGIRGIGPVNDAKEFGRKVRDVSAANYMLATRDLLKSMVWYRRAVQALFAKEK